MTDEPLWRAYHSDIELRGRHYRLRLVEFSRGWLASIDTADGPTLGCDRSTYLAVGQAIDPVGGGTVDAIRITGDARRAIHDLSIRVSPDRITS